MTCEIYPHQFHPGGFSSAPGRASGCIFWQRRRCMCANQGLRTNIGCGHYNPAGWPPASHPFLFLSRKKGCAPKPLKSTKPIVNPNILYGLNDVSMWGHHYNKLTTLVGDVNDGGGMWEISVLPALKNKVCWLKNKNPRRFTSSTSRFIPYKRRVWIRAVREGHFLQRVTNF